MIFLSFVTAFFCGSFPTGFLLGELLKGEDIRQKGSGNIGATNAFRVFGRGWGVAVFAVDFFKGFGPAYLLPALSHQGHGLEFSLALGLVCVLGHVYTPFLGFKGGKGFATGTGVLLAADPFIFLIVILVWVIVFSVTRIVSISSILSSAVPAAISLVTNQTVKTSVLFLAFLIIILITHRSNIVRLIRSEEKPFV